MHYIGRCRQDAHCWGVGRPSGFSLVHMAGCEQTGDTSCFYSFPHSKNQLCLYTVTVLAHRQSKLASLNGKTWYLLAQDIEEFVKTDPYVKAGLVTDW